MAETVCRGCGGVIDFSGIDPFVLCECSECGTELTIPLELDYLKLEKPFEPRGCVEIFEGFDVLNNADSVIFLLEQGIPEYDDFVKLGKEQAAALTTLKHGNVTPIINYGEVEDRFFVTEPKMDGFPLSDYTPETQGQLDVEKVTDVVQAIALGLAVAHHKEFPHHNLCPETIHIDARGNVRIKEFFISRFLFEVENLREEKSSVSPFFISPEKAESGIEDKRGDIFSFGVLFYYMITGKYPFVGSNEIETVYSRVIKKKKAEDEVFSSSSSRIVTPDTVDYVPPTPPCEIRAQVTEDVNELIMKMLEYHPFKRPTMPEILDVINLHKAQKDQQSGVLAAQKQMMTTKTRAIPKMGSLAGGKKKKKKKGFFK